MFEFFQKVSLLVVLRKPITLQKCYEAFVVNFNSMIPE